MVGCNKPLYKEFLANVEKFHGCFSPLTATSAFSSLQSVTPDMEIVGGNHLPVSEFRRQKGLLISIKK